MTACGFAPATIDDMPMHDVLALFVYWQERPPAHEILVAVHAIRPAASPDRDDPSGIGPLIARAPAGRVGRN